MDGDYPRTLPACCQPDKVLDMAFDEGGGQTVVDASGYNNHGAMVNMEEADWVASHDGRGFSLSYDGVNEYINCGNSNLFNFTEFTMKITYNMTDAVAGRRLFCHGLFNADGYESFYDITSGRVHFRTYQAAANQDTASNFPYATGTWISVTWTLRGTIATIYKDGVDDTGAPAAHIAPLASNRNLYIGAYDAGVNPFYGGITTVKLLNSELTASEVLRQYEQPRMPLRDNEQCQYLGAVA